MVSAVVRKVGFADHRYVASLNNIVTTIRYIVSDKYNLRQVDSLPQWSEHWISVQDVLGSNHIRGRGIHALIQKIFSGGPNSQKGSHGKFQHDTKLIIWQFQRGVGGSGPPYPPPSGSAHGRLNSKQCFVS